MLIQFRGGVVPRDQLDAKHPAGLLLHAIINLNRATSFPDAYQTVVDRIQTVSVPCPDNRRRRALFVDAPGRGAQPALGIFSYRPGPEPRILRRGGYRP
ncbi:dihydroxy-acid dehydratase, putative [Babesia ovata]|uniref:Dihydroxy-acid dehydratase, putative n=1 Tax=Babesia ovata TaxID=189622 RepID=A0A2H6KAT1_9APIC|nr:dihydroxy-acid dehydratase, putative [Babesia ovata]GBE60103.1 dihydroxy-acid dehydratase, putative [Babesia ovata]